MKRDHKDSCFEGFFQASRFLYDCYVEEKDSARLQLDDIRGFLPQVGRLNGPGAWECLFAAIEGWSHLGLKEQTAELYPAALEAIEAGYLINRFGHHVVDSLAGVAATAAEKWQEAEAHFEEALRMSEETPFPTEQLDIRRWHGAMLIDRDQPGDRAKARRLLEEAIAGYDEFGMPGHRRLAEAELTRC